MYINFAPANSNIDIFNKRTPIQIRSQTRFRNKVPKKGSDKVPEPQILISSTNALQFNTCMLHFHVGADSNHSCRAMTFLPVIETEIDLLRCEPDELHLLTLARLKNLSFNCAVPNFKRSHSMSILIENLKKRKKALEGMSDVADESDNVAPPRPPPPPHLQLYWDPNSGHDAGAVLCSLPMATFLLSCVQNESSKEKIIAVIMQVRYTIVSHFY